MFSRRKFRPHRSPSLSRRKNQKFWIFYNKKRHRHNDDYHRPHNSVMMSRDSGSFDSRTLPPTSYDLPDDARPGVLPPVIPLTSTTKLPSDRGSDVGGIEEVATITKKTLPSPEPRPKIQHNGNDSSKKIENKLAENTDDDACVKCIYFTQQMCECVIV
ncbi:uncharacterized protein [Chelonus insularis]|uniref:uncharacterized protein isoform X4 n=1 Tax=Chelonus insularis TaxID=460826 RepID=UPI001589B4A6|nr:uncharacterized protein LOC118069492 isoform X4 [Chelonus insularis]